MNAQLIKANVFLALGYIGLAALVMSLFQLPAPLWPPAGLAAFAALVGGWRWMPGIALGSWLANDLLLGWSTPGALWVTFGNVFGPMLAATILHRITPPSASPFDKIRGVAAFFILMGGLNSLVSAQFGASAAVFIEHIDPANFWATLFQWLVGDATCAVILTPALYLWWRDPRFERPETGWREATLAIGLLVSLTSFIFLQSPPQSIPFNPLLLILLPLTWITLRLPQRYTYTLLVFIVVMMLVATLQGHGPFSAMHSAHALTHLQLRASLLGAFILLAGALDGERRQAIRSLAELNAQLEQRVKERTKHIEASHERLRKIVESLPTPMALIRFDTSAIIDANAPAAATFGYQPEELAGAFTHAFYADPNGRETLRRDLETDGIVRDREMRFTHRDGHTLWLLISAALMQDGDHPLILLSFQDITSAKTREQELSHQATTDALTGTANRRHFLEQAERRLRKTTPLSTPTAILILDLDLFKAVNDAHGHLAGDKVLRQVAFAIQASLRQRDLCGRLGGEEFGVLLPDTDLHGALELAERLREAVEQLVIPLEDGAIVRPTISIGGTLADGIGEGNLVRLLSIADQALYAAKKAGRNRVEFRPPAG